MNWDVHKKLQNLQIRYKNRELWLAFQRIREVRRDGRPVDVLAVVDDILDQLDRPVYRDVNNRTDPPGFDDWQAREAERR